MNISSGCPATNDHVLWYANIWTFAPSFYFYVNWFFLKESFPCPFILFKRGADFDTVHDFVESTFLSLQPPLSALTLPGSGLLVLLEGRSERSTSLLVISLHHHPVFGFRQTVWSFILFDRGFLLIILLAMIWIVKTLPCCFKVADPGLACCAHLLLAFAIHLLCVPYRDHAPRGVPGALVPNRAASLWL